MGAPFVTKRSVVHEKFTVEELTKFMRKHGMSEKEMGEMLGVTTMAVSHWLSGYRSISITLSRLLRMFDKHPQLMREF